MIRTIVKSAKNKLTLDLPEDLVGKTIEVIAFSIDDEKGKSNDLPQIADRTAELKKELLPFMFNSGGYKFNRDEANEYE